MAGHNQSAAEPFKYWAFISYSHQDKAWGDWLHKALETYRVPKRLVGRASRDGAVPKRLYPIFRDREELPTSSDLSSNINEALKASRYLVVICSPKSAVSHWVNEEVRAFKAMGREDRILSLIVDGEPNASDQPNSGLLECFPEAIRYRVDGNGQITKERTEPIAADAREGKDGKADAKLKILCGLLGISYDELKQRDRQRQIKERVGMTLAAVFILAVFGIGLYWQARISNSEKYVERGRLELIAGRPAQAAVFLAEAFRMGMDTVTLRLMLGQAMRVLDAEVSTIDDMEFETRTLGWNGVMSGNGAYIVAPSKKEKKVFVWSADSGRRLTSLRQESGWVMDFSPRNDAILLHAQDGVEVVDLSNGESRILAGIEQAKFSADGTCVHGVTKSDKSFEVELKVFDADSGSLRGTIPVNSRVSRAVAPSCATAAVSGGGNSAHIWDTASGRMTRKIVGHTGRINEIAFSPDGTRFVTASDDGTARVWDTATGKAISAFTRHGGPVYSAAFRQFGDLVVTAGLDSARIWVGQTGLEACSLAEAGSGAIVGVRFTSDGFHLITRTARGGHPIREETKLWDLGGCQLKGVMADPIRGRAAAAHSDDGGRFLTLGFDGIAKVWTVKPQLLSSFRGLFPGGRTPDESRFIERSDNALRVRDHKTIFVSVELQSDWRVEAAAISPDGKRLMTAIRKEFDKYALQVWNADTGELLFNLFPSKRVTEAKFSKDGLQIAAAQDSFEVVVWDTWDARELYRVDGAAHGVMLERFALSPDGRHVATVGSGTAVRLWTRPAQSSSEKNRNVVEKSMMELSGHEGPIHHVDFSVDGRRLVSSSSDQTVRVWDAGTGAVLATLQGHTDDVRHAAFVSNDNLIVTGSDDRTVKVWRADSGDLLLTLGPHRDSVRFVRLTSDGNRVESTDESGLTYQWDITPERRTSELIDAILRCRAPWHVRAGELVRRALDRAACTRPESRR